MSHKEALAALLTEAGFHPLTPGQASHLELYIELFLKWNQKTNLSAIRDENEILRRHILESIQCSQSLPPGLGTLLDFGSGGGLPGVPISILHPGIQLTLAESQIKKATFLNEVVRALGLNAKVHSARSETLSQEFDCVTLRAVDRMAAAVSAAGQLVRSGGWLALMTTTHETSSHQAAAGPGFRWQPPIPLYGSDSRVILFGQKI